MKWSLVATVMAVGAVFVPGAAAQTPTQDSVTGSAGTGSGRGFALFTFDVRSGPSGEDPTGTVTIDSFFGVIGPLDATCLSVSANKAGMVVRAPEATSSIAGLAISVEDGGPGQDKIDWHTVMTLPSDCPVPSEPLEPTVSGDVTVSDAPPPPTTYAQCRQAGWVRYGFESHAACTAYVHERARQKCIFERVAHGVVAFRAKYGLAPNQHHAMRHCVRLYTGW